VNRKILLEFELKGKEFMENKTGFRVCWMLLVLGAWFVSPALAKDVVIKEPPASLSKQYPPESKESKWLDIMHKMSGHFGGVFINMGQKDWPNAEKHAQGLADVYEDASKLVPEWKDYFDVKAAKDFVSVVKTHDPAEISKASKLVGKTCGKCHDDNLVAVWTRYHWPSVENIKLEDPIDEKEVEYGKYMHVLSNAFKGVRVNFGDGKNDIALKAAKDFKKRYMELKSTCSKCHTHPGVKQFFVGEDVSKALDAMEAELATDKPNPGVIWKNVGIVGQEGCKKCHLTHRSYVIFRDVWEEEAEAKK